MVEGEGYREREERLIDKGEWESFNLCRIPKGLE
jgi:hypothetical protein